ncbi:MAG: NAD(P)/FAD-dependent oxidoreductase [Clostridiales bacterium]|jgi:thioredoxin reductase (NADPH)|nr:NAD(P)/FAD-dependent oxidoreductase [Clostridiales bacterium]
MIDIAIIGGGPAGLSAAINAAARNKKAVVLSRKKETAALYKAEKINNHLGLPGQTGAELMDLFLKHAREAGVEIRQGRTFQLMPMGSHFMINFDNDFMEAKAVILATGIEKGSKIKGEEEYLGKGVSYCATCDGMLYRGKDVVVIAETEEGEEDANFLSEICNKVYYVNTRGTQPALNKNIEILSASVSEVIGGDYVTAVDAGGQIPVDGAFFIKAAPPLDSLIYGLETRDHGIVVDRAMATNIPGVFACGDVTGKPYQLSKAIGEGQIAGQSTVRYLAAL